MAWLWAAAWFTLQRQSDSYNSTVNTYELKLDTAIFKSVFYPPLCHRPGGSKICHQMNTHLHQGDQNLTRMDNSDKSKDVVCQTFKFYLNMGGNSCWVGMKKCSQDLLIFQISPRVLVLLVERLFLKPQGLPKPTRLDFVRVVTRAWIYIWVLKKFSEWITWRLHHQNLRRRINDDCLYSSNQTESDTCDW